MPNKDTQSIVDSATISQVVQCLDRGMTNLYPWSIQTVTDFTALLIHGEHFSLAPGITHAQSMPLDDQDYLTHILISDGLLELPRNVDQTIINDAIIRSKQWIGRQDNISAVRFEVQSFLNDSINFENWIDWAARNAWVAHAQRYRGLFDAKYIKYISKILNISENDSVELYKRSQKPGELSYLETTRGPDFEIMTSAYMASAIIRGRYHEEVARRINVSGGHLVRHPFRGMVSKTRSGNPIAVINVPQSASFLASIVIYGAMKQSRLKDRLLCWSDNIKKVRSFLDPGGMGLTKGTGEASFNAAFIIAKQAGVQIVNSGFDDFLDAVTSLELGILRTIVLNPWIGVPIGTATNIALKKVGFPKQPINNLAYYTTKNQLKTFSAGRIETKWSNTSNTIML